MNHNNVFWVFWVFFFYLNLSVTQLKTNKPPKRQQVCIFHVFSPSCMLMVIRGSRMSVGSSCMWISETQSLRDALRRLHILGFWDAEQPSLKNAEAFNVDLYSNLSHINVNVLPPLCTCCVIIGLIVCKAVVKGEKGKSAFAGVFCLW